MHPPSPAPPWPWLTRAGLEAIADVIKSQTVLIANPRRARSAEHQRLVTLVHHRIQGYITAQQNCMVTYNVSRALLKEAVLITPGHDSPTITPLEAENSVAVSALVCKAEVSEIMDRLKALGATSILQLDIANCRF